MGNIMLKTELKLSAFKNACAIKELVQPLLRYSSYLPEVGKSGSVCIPTSLIILAKAVTQSLEITRVNEWIEVLNPPG